MYQGTLIELHLFLASILTGIGLMILYDSIRIFRIIIPHHMIWVGMEDLLYWISASVITFFLLYQENDGTIRFCVIFTIFFTMGLYNYIFSYFFLKVLKKGWKWIRIKLSKTKKW